MTDAMKYVFDARYETMSSSDLVALQTKKVRHLLNKTWYNSAFYRKRYEAAHVDPEQIQTLEDFRNAIPTVSKEDFLEDQLEDPPFGRRGRYARELETPLVVTTTSGTSGQGQEIHVQTAREMTLTGEIYSYHFRWAGIMPGQQMFLAMPITLLGGGILEYHGGYVYGLTVYPVGNYDAPRKLELMRRFQPEVLLTNTSYMGRLGALQEPGDAWPNLRCLSTGAEGEGFSYLERLQDTWGARVYDRYGSSQAGNDHMFTCDEGIGTAGRPGLLHNIDPYMLLEVVDAATGKPVRDGELGELVITDLYRTDTPLIRCRLNDQAVYHPAAYCACGRAFGGIETASVTRADGMIKIKGVGVWPKAVADVVFGFPEIEEYQVVLANSADGADVVTVRLSLRRGRTAEPAALVSRLESHLREKIGIRFLADLVPTGTLDMGEWKAKRWVDNRAHA
jgi:phenylacetate-CoA ligase